MALRRLWIGSVGPLLYDDADVYPGTTENVRGLKVEGKLKVTDGPVDSDDVLRMGDIGVIGAPEDAPYVMADNSNMTSNARVITQGSGISISDGGSGGNLTVAVNESQVDHDLLKNYVPNEHIDWTNSAQNLKTSGNVSGSDFILSATGALYFGDPNTDGSWRITRSGNDLVFQRRESGSWVTKLTVLSTGGTS